MGSIFPILLRFDIVGQGIFVLEGPEHLQYNKYKPQQLWCGFSVHQLLMPFNQFRESKIRKYRSPLRLILINSVLHYCDSWCNLLYWSSAVRSEHYIAFFLPVPLSLARTFLRNGRLASKVALLHFKETAHAYTEVASATLPCQLSSCGY